MSGLAFRLLRHRAGSAVATLVALAVGVMILVCTGGVVEAALRHRPEPERYAAADVVVAHREAVFVGRELDGSTVRTAVPLPEGTVPVALAERLRRLPGVAAVAVDPALPVRPLVPGAGPAVGAGWSTAALAPYRLVAGTAPAGDDQVVVDARLAGALPPGRSVDLLVAGRAHRFLVTGVARGDVGADRPAAVFLTDRRAAALDPEPDSADAIGVVAAAGADRAALAAAVGRLAADAGVRAYAGEDRGAAERSGDAAARGLLLTIGGSFGGYVAALVLFVVAGTVGLSVRQRRRDLALLRAVAATPGQVRRLLLAETTLVAVAAALPGVPAGLLAGRWLHGALVDRAVVPATVPTTGGALAVLAAVAATVLVAVLSALLAARRVSAIRPTEALGEVAVEPAGGGRVRLVAGLLALAGAGASGVLTVGLTGTGALAGAVGMLYLFVTAVGLLAPWINRHAARLLAPALRAVWGPSGHLAAANLRANARGTATVLTALVLAVGLGGSVWFLQDNLERQTRAQGRDGLLAQRVLLAPDGLPDAAVADVRRVPGVTAATPVRSTSVAFPTFDGAESIPALAVDPAGAAATTDLGVTEGSLADLDRTTVAVSAVRAAAQRWDLGEDVRLRLADGRAVTLRVAAVYRRGLGFGDVVLDRDTVGPGPADRVLVRTGAAPDARVDAALAAVAARYPTSTVLPGRDLSAAVDADLALSAWLNRLLIGVLVGYAALAAANTMVVAALARRRELALLRLVGGTTRQVRRMVRAEQAGLLGVALVIGGSVAALTLSAVVNAATGDPVPYVPPLGLAAVLAGTAVLALTTTVLPVGRLLRTAPVQAVGTRE